MKSLPRFHPVILLVVLGMQCKQKSVELVIPSCFPTTITKTIPNVSTIIAYNYNANNLVTSTTYTISSYGNSPVTLTVTYTYDGVGNISAATESAGGYNATHSYAYDKNHNLTKDSMLVSGKFESTHVYHYNATQQLTDVQLTASNGSSKNTYSYLTPVTRNPKSLLTGQGITWTYQYDTKPNPLKVLFVSLQPDNNITQTTSSPYGKTTTYTYQYDNKGFPVARTGSDGEAITYTYFCK